ncbi:MAG TPA: CBS domain-containing protein [Candidatus Nanoarchaeia archaeon]|nr:CBS domain-containing protein [Candidatus Nanoarchaeia archaeon]
MKSGYKVLDAMTTKPIVAEEFMSIQECACLMKRHGIGSLLIKAKGKVKSLITEKDIIHKAIVNALDVRKTPISEIADKIRITISPNKDIVDALNVMRENDVRHLPVMEEGKIKGFITMKDILKIEPQLFELIVEKSELKEDNRKSLSLALKEGLCEGCGEFSEDLTEMEGNGLCTECRSS